MVFYGAPRLGRGALFFSSGLVCPKAHIACTSSVQNFFVSPCLIKWEEDATLHQSGCRPQEDVMQLHKHLWKSSFGKAALATAALSAFLLLAGAPSAKADHWDSCNRRLAYVEFRLHESIVYFGYYSPQANYWRHERHEAFEELERYRRRYYRDRDRDRDADRD